MTINWKDPEKDTIDIDIDLLKKRAVKFDQSFLEIVKLVDKLISEDTPINYIWMNLLRVSRDICYFDEVNIGNLKILTKCVEDIVHMKGIMPPECLTAIEEEK